ncbi:MAG: hypothetical protein V4447_10685 [Pseudomonadota bacterium]
MKIHLGVIDIPYASVAPVKDGKPAPAQMTTFGVATILEKKYNLFSSFAALHTQDIAEAVSIGLAETLEALMMGAPASIDPFGAAMSDTEQMFRTFLVNEEIKEVGQDGVPTKAALDGVNHRMKLRRGPRRPSFIDTGLLETSFKAWVK